MTITWKQKPNQKKKKSPRKNKNNRKNLADY